MTDQPTDAIVQRALAFAQTTKFVRQRVVSVKEAPHEMVAKYGTPSSTTYGEVRIEMDWADDDIRCLLEGRSEDEIRNLKPFFAAGMELVVVCSSFDVIHHEFVRVELD